MNSVEKILMAIGVGFMVRVKQLIKKMAFDFLPSSTVLMFHHIDNGNIIVKSGCRMKIKSFVDILDSGVSYIGRGIHEISSIMAKSMHDYF